jgi:osmotically-inducible protein OsmY
MNKLMAMTLALAAAAALSGCGNTLSGAKQDAANDTAKTQQAADQADQTMKTDAQKADQAAAALPENAEANTVVRPAVKTAIIRDPVLTQSGNLIDVNAAPQKITLTGHVTTADMKQRATEDAQVALKKHPGYMLVNDLTVAGQ